MNTQHKLNKYQFRLANCKDPVKRAMYEKKVATYSRSINSGHLQQGGTALSDALNNLVQAINNKITFITQNPLNISDYELERYKTLISQINNNINIIVNNSKENREQLISSVTDFSTKQDLNINVSTNMLDTIDITKINEDIDVYNQSLKGGTLLNDINTKIDGFNINFIKPEFIQKFNDKIKEINEVINKHTQLSDETKQSIEKFMLKFRDINNQLNQLYSTLKIPNNIMDDVTKINNELANLASNNTDENIITKINNLTSNINESIGDIKLTPGEKQNLSSILQNNNIDLKNISDNDFNNFVNLYRKQYKYFDKIPKKEQLIQLKTKYNKNPDPSSSVSLTDIIEFLQTEYNSSLAASSK